MASPRPGGWPVGHYPLLRNPMITAGKETKTVYVQYRDRAGNVSAAALDSIVYRP